MANLRLAGIAHRKPALGPGLLRTLLICALLLPASMQVCHAVTVPGTVADSNATPHSAVLPEIHDVSSTSRGAGTGIPGVADSDALRERQISASLTGEQRSGVRQADSDTRLYLFALLGFAAIAAWLIEVTGRVK